MEATLTPLMEAVEDTTGVKVFSLPCVDHPNVQAGHIELGVKGPADMAEDAFVVLRQGHEALAVHCGPEMVR